jgi:hypothetical protein
MATVREQTDPTQRRRKSDAWVKRQLSRLERRRRKDLDASTRRTFRGYVS